MRLRSVFLSAAIGSLLAVLPTGSASATTAPYTLSGLWPALGAAPSYGYLPALFQWQGKHVAIVNIFSNGTTDFSTMDDVWNIWHAVPMLSYAPPVPNSLAAAGTFDSSDFLPLINKVKTFIAGLNGVLGDGDDRRMYLRYGWEPNVKNMSWSPCSTGLLGHEPASNYVASWRHVHELFTDAGLDNTRVAWIYSVATGDACTDGSPERTYPGSDVVDWVGLDVYAKCGGYTNDLLTSHNMLARLTGVDPTKPVGFNEAGVSSYMSNESPTAPLNAAVAAKNQWITDYWNYIHNNNIRMAVWFNGDKGLDPDCDQFEKPWAYFGPLFGDESFTDGLGTPFKGFSAYRIAIQQPWVLDTDTHNLRYLTDAQFLGL